MTVCDVRDHWANGVTLRKASCAHNATGGSVIVLTSSVYLWSVASAVEALKCVDRSSC
jgi:hypothetical protein